MIKILKEGDTISTRAFGGFCPYYYRDEETGKVIIGDAADEMIDSMSKEKRRLDSVACLGLFNFNYPLGDRTLIQGLQRMPWHTTLDASGTIERHPPIPHGHRLAEPAEIAASLLDCLKEEISTYLDGHKQVWILLSGGLDSRITAGVVKKIQNDFPADIHAVTWGMKNSRDVVYGRQIAERFDWEWHHLPYNETTLWENLRIAAEWGGGELAGIHLHCENQLGNLVSPEDVVIASSWGDSIGRAEFSGRHLLHMTIPPIVNKYWLIHRSLYEDCLQLATADRQLAWCTEPDWSTHVITELDSQENYMRRMISHAMNYIRHFCCLEQSFTAEKTVKTMWSYSPICRQAEVYFRLLEGMDPFLFQLPWARTGVAPSGNVEKDDSLTTTYHEWGRWLRQGRHKDLKNLICDGGLSSLGIFNMSQVHQCYNLWRRQPLDSIGRTEAILQLAGIELMRRRFELVYSGDRTDLFDMILAKVYTVGKKINPYLPAPK